MTLEELIPLIRARGDEADALRAQADALREAAVGDEVHIRGIIEFSNYCRCDCAYCGLRTDNESIARYRLSPEAILEAARVVATCGLGTVVLQSGEDMWWTAERMADLIRAIKSETSMAVTLSLGERDAWEYEMWRDAGADRYLLRHETADPDLYARLHPGCSFEHRVGCLQTLRKLGYQVGAGSIVGLPDQTDEALAEDLLFMRRFDLHMGSVGPLIPHAATPLAGLPVGDTETVLNMMALLRILIPDIMLPATTSLETAMPDGRLRGLQSGANVIMPNLTPRTVARDYDIYPGKRAPHIEVETEVQRAKDIIHRAGRRLAGGPGHSPRAGA